MGKKVCVIKTGDSFNEIKESIYTSLEIIEYENNKVVNTVAIKPNLCYYWDSSTGYTTNPQIVETIIDWVRDKFGSDVNIKIVESGWD